MNELTLGIVNRYWITSTNELPVKKDTPMYIRILNIELIKYIIVLLQMISALNRIRYKLLTT